MSLWIAGCTGAGGAGRGVDVGAGGRDAGSEAPQGGDAAAGDARSAGAGDADVDSPGLPERVPTAIYYVSTAGSDMNPGTSRARPWRHIAHAAAQAQAGNLVYVEAGNYGRENIRITASGTARDPIRLEGYRSVPGDVAQPTWEYGRPLDPSAMPLLDGGGRGTAGIAIEIGAQQHIQLQNFQVTNFQAGVVLYGTESAILDNVVVTSVGDINSDYDGIGIQLSGGARNNRLHNCFVLNAAAEGIGVNGDGNTISGCKVYADDNRTGVRSATDYYLVLGPSANDNTIVDCYIERVGSLAHGGHGITVKGTGERNLLKNSIVKNTYFELRHRGVRNNTVEDCTVYGRSFDIRDGASDNLLRRCRTVGSASAVMFYDTTEDGGAQYVGRNNRFENCLFEGTTGAVIDFYPVVESPADGNSFFNCTIVGGQYLFDTGRSNFGNRMVNCIVAGVQSLQTGPYPLRFDFTYNDFWDNGFASPAGTGNRTEDPLFADAAHADYRLGGASPCVDRGTPAEAPPDDFDGMRRPQGAGYDIGAHEHLP